MSRPRSNLERFDYDAVMKDLFMRDRPSILADLVGTRKVRSFPNPELRVVQKRVADLLLDLDDGTILHIDFQNRNDRWMAHREGIYGLMVSYQYERGHVEQAVIYLGASRLKMPAAICIGEISVRYRLIDIREYDAEELLASGNPGDYALALLARNGVDKIRGIVGKANRLRGARRQRVLTQMAVLSGLRGASKQLTMELKTMGIQVDINKNEFLRDIRDSALAQGRAEGRAAGRVEGQSAVLLTQLEDRFGRVPGWAKDRIARGTAAQTQRWARKVLRAETLEEVVGPKR